MAKNKKNMNRFKASSVVSKKNLNKLVVDNQLQQMGDRLNQLIDSIVKLQQQTEVNRLGIVTINKLNTEKEWPGTLVKTRQFIFGLIKVLEDKYPGILDEVHKCLSDTNATYAEIENIIGAFNAPVGYTINEFKEVFQNAAFFKDDGPINHDEDMAPTKVMDEEGSDEDAKLAFDKFFKDISPDAGIITSSPTFVDESVPSDIKICEKCHSEFTRPDKLSDYNWSVKKKCGNCSKKK